MMTRGASKQTRKLSSGLSRLSEEIIQTSQQMKEKRLRSETVQKTSEETEESSQRTSGSRRPQLSQSCSKNTKHRRSVRKHMTSTTRHKTKKGPDHPGARVAVKRQEQLGVSSQGAKENPQGLAEGDIREQRPDATLDVLAAGDSTSTEGAQDSTTDRLHQTCRPVKEFEHVCVEECPLTTRHTAAAATAAKSRND